MVSNDESGICAAIVDMLQNRWFDGLRGEDGLQVLSELLECGQSRSELAQDTIDSLIVFAEGVRFAVLKAGAINVLCNMIDSRQYESTYAGLHYLRVVARFGWLSCPILLRTPLILLCRRGWKRAYRSGDAQSYRTCDRRIACSTTTSATNRDGNLAVPLRTRYSQIGHRTMFLDEMLTICIRRGSAHDDNRWFVESTQGARRGGGLCCEHRVGNPSHGGCVVAFPPDFERAHTLICDCRAAPSVRDRVLKEDVFWSLSHNYYNGLHLEYDEKGRGPHRGAYRR